MRRIVVLLFAALVLPAVGCASQASTSGSNSGAEPARATTFSESEGRVVADAVAEAVIAEDLAAVYEAMHSTFRSVTPPDQLGLETVYAYGGKPLEAEFKMDEAGAYTTPQGTYPARKYWYAVSTTEAPKGKYFMFVEVAGDTEGPACMSVSIVSFVNGVPDGLQ